MAVGKRDSGTADAAMAEARPAPRREPRPAKRDRLLVVDDDPELRELITHFLQRQGYDIVAVADGTAMDRALASRDIDLIVLDLMLPGEDGLSIARRLKNTSDVPIIIVSAHGEDVDRIEGLEVGADDYMAKPFNPRELLARIRAVLRRSRNPGAEVVEFGGFRLDSGTRRLLRDGNTVSLTSGEFDLLSVLVRHPNQVLHRDRILDLLTGAERSPFDRSIDVRITRLRSKIEPQPNSPTYIRTVWGKGYMFCPDV